MAILVPHGCPALVRHFLQRTLEPKVPTREVRTGPDAPGLTAQSAAMSFLIRAGMS